MPTSKTLYLLRHAKAETGSATLDDHERGINQQGLDACVVIGKYITEAGISPDLVLCSTAKRAKTTWALVREASKNTSKQEFTDMLYLASANEVVKQLMCLPESIHSVMVVGHNPGLHQLSLDLSKKADDATIDRLMLKFPTCALATIDLGETSWEGMAQAHGSLKAFVTPRFLTESAS
jgi:phosphohistidine phosphatase